MARSRKSRNIIAQPLGDDVLPESKPRATRPDGRRNNKPPAEHQIQLGEVRNRYGRKGRPDRGTGPNKVDQLFLQESERVVVIDEDGPVTIARRLVQEELHGALKNADVSAARSRALAQISGASDRLELELGAFVDHVIAQKYELTERFYWARKTKQRAPDILPHPDHVKITNGNVEIVGPIDRSTRAWWELMKGAITVAAFLHFQARTAYQKNPNQKRLTELKASEKHRRKLMRLVPKGWNWREDIYCIDSRQAFTADLIKYLSERKNG